MTDLSYVCAPYILKIWCPFKGWPELYRQPRPAPKIVDTSGVVPSVTACSRSARHQRADQELASGRQVVSPSAGRAPAAPATRTMKAGVDNFQLVLQDVLKGGPESPDRAGVPPGCRWRSAPTLPTISACVAMKLLGDRLPIERKPDCDGAEGSACRSWPRCL